MTTIALVLALLAAYVEIQTRRRLGRSHRLVRHLRGQIDRLEADLRHAKADRDQVSSDLDAAHLAGSALSADLHLARLQLDDAHQAFEFALVPLRESRAEAIRDRDANSARCVELTQRVTELECNEVSQIGARLSVQR